MDELDNQMKIVDSIMDSNICYEQPNAKLKEGGQEKETCDSDESEVKEVHLEDNKSHIYHEAGEDDKALDIGEIDNKLYPDLTAEVNATIKEENNKSECNKLIGDNSADFTNTFEIVELKVSQGEKKKEPGTQANSKTDKKVRKRSESPWRRPYWIQEMDQWLEKKKRPRKNDIKPATKEKKSKKDKKSPIVLTEDDYHWGLDWDQSEAFGNKVDPSTMSVNNRYRNMMGIMGLCPDWLLRLMVTLISVACWYNVYVGLFVRQSV